jgi:hypothetical protein
MSNLNAIGMIGALFLVGNFLSFHAVIVLRRDNAGILGGIIGGAPIPHEFGRQTIWRVQLPMTFFAGACSLVFAFVFLAIADNVPDTSIATLAHVCAIVFFGGSAMWLISAPASFAALLRMHGELGAE